MDSRNNLQHPFARPLSQSSAHDPRQAPIPPPPYTLQAPTHRLQPSLNNDPFLPRRNERDEPRQEPSKPLSQGPFTLSAYAAGLHRHRESTGAAKEIRDRPQEHSHGGPWMPRLADGRTDRYRHHTVEGMLQLSTNADALPSCYILNLAFHVSCCLCAALVSGGKKQSYRFIVRYKIFVRLGSGI